MSSAPSNAGAAASAFRSLDKALFSASDQYSGLLEVARETEKTFGKTLGAYRCQVSGRFNPGFMVSAFPAHFLQVGACILT